MREERGSLSVEAAIFIPLFIVFFVSLMNLVNAVRTQIIIQNAVIQTTKELSQYSYILTKCGIVEASNRTYVKAKGFQDDVNSVANDAIQIANAVNDGVMTGDIINSMNTIEDSANNMSDTLDTYMENPENLFAGVIAVAKNKVQSAAKAQIIGAIVKNRIKTNLAAAGYEPDAMLIKLGIKNGLMGIDFSESKWFDGDSQDIMIVATYTLNVKYMYKEMELPKFKVCGATHIW